MLTHRESTALSLIRVLAVILIVSCHFLQGVDSKLAWWLNVGVQIFFFLSGYLVGFKRVDNYIEWYKKRIQRVLKPYYIYFVLVLLIYLIFKNEYLNLRGVLTYIIGLPGILANISGLEHLWFIPVIMLCYLIVPFPTKYNIGRNKNSEIKFIGFACIQFIILQLLLFKFGYNFASGIATFLIGFYFAKRYQTHFPKHVKYSLLALTLIFIPINIYLQNVITSRQSFAGTIFMYEFAWHHVLMGITICVFLFDYLRDFSHSGVLQQKLKFIDSYSYEIYLTHHIYILGASSLLFVTPFMVVNILIILMGIGISSFMLKKLNNIPIKKMLT